MRSTPKARRLLAAAAAAAALAGLCVTPASARPAPEASGPARASSAAEPSGPALAPGTRFYIEGDSKAFAQALADRRANDPANAKLMDAMASYPVAEWFTGSATPEQTTAAMSLLQAKAAPQNRVPVAVAYNVPGRDCSQYSSGGASNSAEYATWVDALAKGIGDRKTVVILEPDGLALSPTFCGGTAEQQADRLEEINDAVDRLRQQPGAVVYLDAGHSSWHAVGEMAQLLLDGGISRARGFFLNVSNYRTDSELTRYGTQVAQCVWYLDNVEGSQPDDCPNQWWPAADADAWYADHVPAGARLPHFVIDSSRNGKGPWTPTVSYPDPQEWCNPPGRGLGTRPTSETGVPLLDAFLWIKVPGESDGSCTRGTAGPTDPEYGIVDPAAGAWWPDQAHSLAANATPRLTFNTNW
ncbi:MULTISPECIES: glycoside hydrolase family 6 protein [Streptomyces]|uniref:Glucanase n=1 Tax=Streptomyces chilikensis TaxID=1194079 RepID=A0ABV3EPR0_9ACTN|nr:MULTISPECIES: glycoside hydrolase family 6 protein [Streptomyces]MDH6227074.1 endoglucanase [Streptomyces sp. MJP52]